MAQTTQAANSMQRLPPRAVLRKTRGQSRGPVTRLMSPSNLGQVLKPFVFLDLAEADTANLPKFPKHPHSGIATVSVVTKGNMRFHHPTEGEGVIAYGGLEWMRAGASGMGMKRVPAIHPPFKPSNSGSRFRPNSKTGLRYRSSSKLLARPRLGLRVS